MFTNTRLSRPKSILKNSPSPLLIESRSIPSLIDSELFRHFPPADTSSISSSEEDLEDRPKKFYGHPWISTDAISNRCLSLTNEPARTSDRTHGLENSSNSTVCYIKAIEAKKVLSPSQILFEIARGTLDDRVKKIDRLRHYLEEQLGISTFLTLYKWIKSSTMPIDLRSNPFSHFRNFIPHLCCLIILESEKKNGRC